jgi:acetone carboxylase gamma subunit
MPTKSQAHIDRALTNMSVAYMQEESAFIADRVFPKIPVRKQSDVYFVYNKGDFFRDEARVRGGGTESVGGEYGVEAAAPYYCKVHAFHKDVNEQERANHDEPLNADQDATDFVTQKMLVRRETDWASKFFTTGVWTREIDGVDSTPGADESIKFDNDSSDPIRVITNEIVNMASQTGFKPNTLVMSPHVFYALKNHGDILERIKYTQKGIVTSDLLATLFEVDRVFVPWGVVNDAVQGADDEIDFIMGKHMLLCYVNPRPALKKPSAGYTFTWTGFQGSGAFGNRIVRLPMDMLGLGTERIEGEIAFDHKVISQDVGTFFKDIVD